ncbi:cell envelope integrity protein TolA [Erythrobacter sp. A6_0]|uniref:cell envelope integrity protein TolA n=1 Tax=Erythrobacter sp. A6_0 TaxID=2821089 RepID=UPI001ADBD7F1|nr:cell envelope integrity protein TolA [Erythrobacter sp. A6_0]MBO9511679.1 cell envelope integrity protein TolA [Erythrobacter sp. A6_0]
MFVRTLIAFCVTLSAFCSFSTSAQNADSSKQYDKDTNGFYFCYDYSGQGANFTKTVSNVAQGSVQSIFDADISESVHGYDPAGKEIAELDDYKRNDGRQFADCTVAFDDAQIQRMWDRAQDWDGPRRTANVSNLTPSAPKRRSAIARWPSAGSKGGYTQASIGVDYRFIACSGEIVMAYAIDPKSVKVGPSYTKSDFATVSTAGKPVPSPSAITLRGTIRFDLASDPSNVVGRRFASQKFYDEFAGDSLGDGCFTGQTRSIGRIADLVGPRPAKGEVEAFLAGLEFINLTAGDGPLMNAALDSSVRDPDANRLAKERAEAQRLAAEKAEAEDLARRWAETERKRAEIEARAAAERKAHADAVAKYERDLAAKKAADEKYARDVAAFEAETRRVKASRAEYERKMKEYREAIANGAKPAKPQ